MSATGYSPILIYGSTTTGNTPAAGNLTTGTSGVELAINATDGKLFYKDNAGVVQTIATKAGAAGTFSNVTITGGSINGTTIGATTASTGAFTTLSASSTVSGTGFSTYLASPPAIGGTTPAAGSFTTLSASSTVSGTGFSTYLASPPAIGSTAANTGAFTTLSASSTTTLSGGTANGVAYLNGSKVVTTGTALTFDGTTLTNETGSGVFASRDNFNLRAYAGSTNGTVVDINSAGTVGITKFSINNSEQMRLTSTGLGIGTSSPGSKLTVLSTGSTIEAKQSSAGAATYYVMDTTVETNGKRWRFGYTGASGTTPGMFSFLNVTDNVIGPVIDSSGNLGLGVTPSAWNASHPAFQFKYNTAISSYSSNDGLELTSNGYADTATTWKYIESYSAAQYVVGGGQHAWKNAALGTAGAAITWTQAMTLDASGVLNVGATVFSFAKRAGFRGDSTTVATVEIQNESATGTMLTFRTNGESQVGSVSFTNTGVLYNITSDARAKHDIVDAPEASGLIDAIKVRKFKWNANDSEQRYGFIAQELVTVAPEAVHQPADPEEMMAVDYSKLVPMLVKEIQSLRQRVAQLEGK